MPDTNIMGDKALDTLMQNISSAVDAWKVASPDSWEPSEPLTVGGGAGLYTCRAPFINDCEFSILEITGGAGGGQVDVSSTQHTSPLDYTGATKYTELSGFDGYSFKVPALNTLGGPGVFHPVRDSSNTVYVNVVGTCCFVTIMFRQKR